MEIHPGPGTGEGGFGCQPNAGFCAPRGESQGKRQRSGPPVGRCESPGLSLLEGLPEAEFSAPSLSLVGRLFSGTRTFNLGPGRECGAS